MAALSRRDLLAGAAIAGLAQSTSASPPAPVREPFIYSLNTSTIRGQNLTVSAEVDIAAKAGYQAFEPWINELEAPRARGREPSGSRPAH